ncbi:MAG: hypothetical protein KA479_11130 [Saprospiraceae bacterium]|nr:hypothetical protein [Saprospiraceae bacterium]
MSEQAPKLNLQQDESIPQKSVSTIDKVNNTLTEELILGICYPIGSSKEILIENLSKVLKEKYSYKVEVIKLSKYIKEYSSNPTVEGKKGHSIAYSELMSKIEEGNELRKRINSAVLAELAIYDIHISRRDDKKSGKPIPIKELKTRRICYIIDSIKNKEELDLFRSIYRDIFYLFSVFSPKHIRESNLQVKDLNLTEIKSIINTDEYESVKYGQNVRNTFINGDFIVRIPDASKEDLLKKVSRYLSLIFEDQIITPLAHETAMYEAKSAAGNSACLSRQVGAAITNSAGEIISRGWNDVPKYGGNLYRDDDAKDSRCFKEGKYCRNDERKDLLSCEIADSIFEPLLLQRLLEAFRVNISIEDIRNELSENSGKNFIEEVKDRIRRSSKIKDLIEFSRSVHAEMHAIIIGCQLAGNQMIGGKLYCTTYPCHNCGRHIISAGIIEVYYIEPYVKSLCLTLHQDSMTEDERDIPENNEKVKILMYDGVAPRRYLEFFTMNASRKSQEGRVVEVDTHNVKPKTQLSIQALPTLETQALYSLSESGLKPQ